MIHFKKFVDQTVDFEGRPQYINLFYEEEFKMFDAKKTIIKAKKVSIVVRKTIEQKVVVVVIEVAKPKTIAKNIDFFDFTMLLNLLEFRISIISASFLLHLIEFVVKYQEKNVLKTLKINLRDFALQ